MSDVRNAEFLRMTAEDYEGAEEEERLLAAADEIDGLAAKVEKWEEVASYWHTARAFNKSGPQFQIPPGLISLLDRALGEEAGGE